ncbi:hypothetical protein CASFOL_002977 [Castilleja foliolosa]|uniref:C2H2-type domain-containing protein n=1 Tax=Castilleja foliolosa TaxID=1961234 RepID=A0ABD3EGI6_9LAMI
MGRILKCPVCQIRLSSRKLILVHIVKHHPSPVDLLPWKIKTRRRGSNSLALVEMQQPPVANENILAVAEQPMPPPPPPAAPAALALAAPAANGMELVPYDINRVMDLPVVKRLALIHSVATNRNQHICHICGKIYASGRALGGHKAQHTIANRKRARRVAGGGAMVVHEPQNRPVGPHQCQRCGRVFASGQGLGGHKQHCRRRAIRDFDLNEMPEEED